MASDLLVSVAKGHIDQRVAAEAEKVARGEKVEGHYLTYFLSQTGLPMKSVYSNVTELLLAGVDTVGMSPLSVSFFAGFFFQSSSQLKPPICCFRSPAPCPGRYMSCPVTQRCRTRSGRRC